MRGRVGRRQISTDYRLISESADHSWLSFMTVSLIENLKFSNQPTRLAIQFYPLCRGSDKGITQEFRKRSFCKNKRSQTWSMNDLRESGFIITPHERRRGSSPFYCFLFPSHCTGCRFSFVDTVQRTVLLLLRYVYNIMTWNAGTPHWTAVSFYFPRTRSDLVSPCVPCCEFCEMFIE